VEEVGYALMLSPRLPEGAGGPLVEYQAGRTLVNRKIRKALAVLGATLVIGALSVDATAKPYQRERIRIALGHVVHSGQES
jgi:hypothetical protein